MNDLMLNSSFALASAFHAGETRKSGQVPVLAHLMSVSATTLEMGGTAFTASCALLHDVLEDVDDASARETIRGVVGNEGLAIIEEVTETDLNPKPPWRSRKELYIQHIMASSIDALTISIADKRHNALDQLRQLRSNPEMWTLFNAPRSDQQWWYFTLVQAMYTRLDQLTEAHAQRTELMRPFLDELQQTVIDLFADDNTLQS